MTFGDAVAAEAIDAVEFEFFFEIFAGDEASEGGGAHVGYVHEVHVSVHHADDLLTQGVAVFHFAQPAFGDFGTHLCVSGEADASVFDGAGLGFADVVEEYGQCEGGGGGMEVVEHHDCMGPDIALGMEFRGLFAALEV